MDPAAPDPGPGAPSGLRPPSAPGRPWVRAALMLAFGVAGLVMMHHPMLLSGLRRVQVDRGDSRLINYLLEHTHRWSLGRPLHRGLWDPPFFYPTRNVGAYSDLLLGIAPIYWAWRRLGLPPDTAYQLWLIGVSALNDAAGLLLLRRGIGFGPLAAAAGAFLIAFGAPVVNQLGHPQLVPQVFLLLVTFALVGLFGADGLPRARRAGLWGLAILGSVAQLYTAFYPALFFGLGLVAAAGAALVVPSWRAALLRRLRGDVPIVLGVGAIAAALLVPWFEHYGASRRLFGPRYYPVVRMSLPEWGSWVHVGPGHWLWGWADRAWLRSTLPMENEKRLGVGPITLAASLAGLIAGRGRPAVRVAGVAALGLVVCIAPVPSRPIAAAALVALLGGLALLARDRRAGPAALAGLGVVLFVAATPRVNGDPVPGVVLFALVLALLEAQAAGDDRRRRLGAGLAAGAAAVMAFSAWACAIAAACLAPAVGLAEGARWRHRAVVRRLAPWAGLGLLVVAGLADRPGDGAYLAAAGLAWAAAGPAARRSRVGPGSALTAAGAGLAGVLVFRGVDVVWDRLYVVVPGADAIRAVARCGLVAGLALGLGLAAGVEALAASGRRRLALALALTCALEQGVTTPSFDKAAERRLVADLAARVDRRAEAFYYSAGAGAGPFWELHFDAMWAGLAAEVPTINGGSGHTPLRLVPLEGARAATRADLDRLEAALRGWIAFHGLRPDRIDWVGGRRLAPSPGPGRELRLPRGVGYPDNPGPRPTGPARTAP